MFKLEIETDNAAFEGENLGSELATHLRDLADKLESTTRGDFASMARKGHRFRIRDSNGNPVGAARIADIDSDDSE